MPDKTYIMNFKDGTTVFSSCGTPVVQAKATFKVGLNKGMVSVMVSQKDLENYDIKISVCPKQKEWWIL